MRRSAETETIAIEYPDRIHFHSYESRVSLELPVGWEVEQESDGQVVYACRDDADAAVVPKLVVRALAVPPDRDAWRRLAEQLVVHDDATALRSDEIVVDEVPARVDVIAYDEPQVGERVAQYTAVAQISDVAFVFSGVVAESARDRHLPVFDEALRSARFILV